MSEPIDLAKWGKDVLRPAREDAGLTRAQLARQTGIAESTLRNIEGGRHAPRSSRLRPICLALGLTNPLGSAETMSVPIGGLDRDRAFGVLKAALGDFVRVRSDAKAFAEQLCPKPGIDQFEAQCQADDDRQDAAEILAAIVADERNRQP